MGGKTHAGAHTRAETQEEQVTGNRVKETMRRKDMKNKLGSSIICPCSLK